MALTIKKKGNVVAEVSIVSVQYAASRGGDILGLEILLAGDAKPFNISVEVPMSLTWQQKLMFMLPGVYAQVVMRMQDAGRIQSDVLQEKFEEGLELNLVFDTEYRCGKCNSVLVEKGMEKCTNCNSSLLWEGLL